MARYQPLPEARTKALTLPERIDIRAIERLRPFLQARLARQIGKLGQAGDEPPLFIASAALFAAGLIARRPDLERAAIRMALAHLFTIGIKEWGKNHVDRSRPDQQLKQGSYHMALGRSRDPALRSFPSGHSAGAVAVARAFGRDVPRHADAAAFTAVLIGALQVVRRAHYPGDVIVGALAGVVAEKVASALLDRVKLPGFA